MKFWLFFRSQKQDYKICVSFTPVYGHLMTSLWSFGHHMNIIFLITQLDFITQLIIIVPMWLIKILISYLLFCRTSHTHTHIHHFVFRHVGHVSWDPEDGLQMNVRKFSLNWMLEGNQFIFKIKKSYHVHISELTPLIPYINHNHAHIMLYI